MAPKRDSPFQLNPRFPVSDEEDESEREYMTDDDEDRAKLHESNVVEDDEEEEPEPEPEEEEDYPKSDSEGGNTRVKEHYIDDEYDDEEETPSETVPKSKTSYGYDSESPYLKPQFSPANSDDLPAKPIVKSASKREHNGIESPQKKKRRVSNGDEENGEKDRKSIFSRLWSEDDEIAILKGMVEYKLYKDDPYKDMEEFHEYIKDSLHVNVSKNQLTDKIKRLKKKFMTKAEKGETPVFAKTHDRKAFEFSKQIWGGCGSAAASKRRIDENPKSINKKEANKKSVSNPLRLVKEEKHEFAPEQATKGLNNGVKASTSGVKASQDDFWLMYPRLNESLQSGDGLYSSLSESGRKLLKERMSSIGSAKAEKLEEKWRNLQLAEYELYVKRVDLIQEQTKLVLAEMKTSKS